MCVYIWHYKNFYFINGSYMTWCKMTNITNVYVNFTALIVRMNLKYNK